MTSEQTDLLRTGTSITTNRIRPDWTGHGVERQRTGIMQNSSMDWPDRTRPSRRDRLLFGRKCICIDIHTSWALMGRALMGPPWALMGPPWALMGTPGPLWAPLGPLRAGPLWAPLGPLWAPHWALMGALMGLEYIYIYIYYYLYIYIYIYILYHCIYIYICKGYLTPFHISSLLLNGTRICLPLVEDKVPLQRSTPGTL